VSGTDLTVVLGHCTRLALWGDVNWRRFKDAIGDLPISIVGLPTSDMFMMRDANDARGTLAVPQLIRKHGLNACLGINNIGNAFTPHGSCDPLTLACHGIGIYNAGTKEDAEVLYECVSTRARAAIGLGNGTPSAKRPEHPEVVTLETREGDGDFVLFAAETPEWRTRKTVAEAVYLYDHCQGRRGIVGGRLVL
jgi:hypothetical protein